MPYHPFPRTALAILVVAASISAAIKQIPLPMPTFNTAPKSEAQDLSYRANYPVALSAIKDQRQMRDSVEYHKKTGDNQPIALPTSQPVAAWISSALVQCAGRYGVIVAPNTAAQSLSVSLTITEIGGVAGFEGYSSRVALEAEVRNSESVVWSGAVAGASRMAASLPVSDYDFGACLKFALGRALDTLSMHLAEAVDKQHATAPVALISRPFGGKYRPDQIDSICDLGKSVYIINGSRTAQEVYDYLSRREYLFKDDQKSALDVCPLIKGDIFLILEIAGDGTIDHVDVARSDIDCPVLVKKMSKNFHAMQLSGIKSAEPTAVVYKIRFEDISQAVAAQKRAGRIIGGMITGVLLLLLNLFLIPSMTRIY
jgi:hypothetical protein